MTKKDGAVHSFSIIRYKGQPTKATTLDGYNVERQEQFFVDEEGFNVFIKAAQYDDHFIYEDPAYRLGAIGRHKFMCTCGSEAVIVGYDVYKGEASPEGALIVCKYYATMREQYKWGFHATGGTKWI